MGSRRKGRILAMQALFAWETGHPDPEFLYTFPWLDPERLANTNTTILEFARYLTAGSIEHIEEIDEAIRMHLDNWDITRISRVDLAVLRLSVYSLLYQRDIPASVTIDEAVEIAKEYSGDESFRFVNGVLDGLRKDPAHDVSEV